ncbi:hypothetical protein MMC25_005348 [Agyrium rufum]|nr:hypothetical protein [Agyrium rufum]
MANMSLDILRLANFCALEEDSITTLTTNPTVELVSSLLRNISDRATELEEKRAQSTKWQIERESIVHANDMKIKLLKGSTDKKSKEVEDLKQKLQDEQTAKAQLASELEAIKTSTSSSSSEVTTLNIRIQSLESANRDLSSLLESKLRAHDQVTQDLSQEHKKLVDLKGELSAAENTILSLRSEATNTKYRDDSLQMEIDSYKRTNEWLDTELKTKTAELTKTRKEKSAQVAQFQRQNEDATTALELSKRTEQSLRTRVDELGEKCEEYLQQIQMIRTEASRNIENLRAELDGAERLRDLLSQSLETERAHRSAIQQDLEKTREDAAEEIGRISSEIETEHQDKLHAEQRIQELESENEKLRTEAKTSKESAQANTVTNGDRPSTPDRFGSPARIFSPNSSRVRGGLNYTQLYSEYQKAKAELDNERRRNEKLGSTIDGMIQEMEAKAPELEELQVDNQRLEADVVQLSTFVDSISDERDEAKKAGKQAEARVNGLLREGELLRQQLRDLSAQVKVLLLEVNAHHNGLESYTPDQRRKLEELARDTYGEVLDDNVTDTDRFISENLTTFRNVKELQERNMNLLHTIREVGARMEKAEAEKQEQKAIVIEQELQTTQEKLERTRDALKSLTTQSDSYARERDMFRRMLSQKGRRTSVVDGESILGDSTQDVLNISQQSTKDLADYAKLLKELQAHFDSYKEEAASDRLSLKGQVDALSKQNNELRGENARRKGETSTSEARYSMLQGNYQMLKSENSRLLERSQELSEKTARQEIQVQAVAEQLIDARELAESSQREAANLKAEKEFWKTIEGRLKQDNQHLTAERDRLNDTNIKIQSLLNERDLADQTSKRKSEAQIETLTADSEALRRKLSDQAEDLRKATLRTEHDQQQAQRRIDDLFTSLSSAREELASAKMSRDHLQSRLDEIAADLRTANERLDASRVIQQTPTVTNGDRPEEPTASREEELQSDLTELREAVDNVRKDLENARSQVEQYKAISQSSEEELSSLNETQEQYREQTDALIKEKDDKIQELDQKLSDLQTNMGILRSDLITAQTEKVESDKRLQDQKSTYESEISALKDSDERHKAQAEFHQEDLKAQADIAREAQQSYENELVKHAEAARNLQALREDYSQYKLDSMQLKAEAQNAQKSLAASEQRWAEIKNQYERELSDIKSRRNDAENQNKLLYKQLEGLNKQIGMLQENRTAAASTSEDQSQTPDSGALQELNSYLRREKEILDVQFELASQKVKRLEQQLTHTQSQLDEAKLKINQQRRLEENDERNALNHNKLMETINELNLNRESNATLRLEKNQAQAALAEKSQAVETLTMEVQTLRAQIGELEDASEATQGELRMAREARERFEQRYHDLLRKSDSIDPAEYENLKQQVTTLTEARESAQNIITDLQTTVDSIPEQLKQLQDSANEKWQESRTRLIEQSKAKAREQANIIRDKDAALKAAQELAITEKQSIQDQLSTQREDFEAAKLERDEAFSELEKLRAESQKPSNNQEANGASDEVSVPEGNSIANGDLAQAREELAAATAREAASDSKAQELETQVNAAQVRVAELEQQLFAKQEALDEALTKAQELESALNEVRSRNSQAVEPVAESNASAEDGEVLNGNAPDDYHQPDQSQPLEAQVAAIRVELEARHEQRVKTAEESFQKRADNMKQQLNQKLREKESVRQSLVTTHTQDLESLRAQHQQQIQELEQRHQREIEELKRSEETKFEEFKQHMKKVSNGSAGDGDSAVKPETAAPRAAVPASVPASVPVAVPAAVPTATPTTVPTATALKSFSGYTEAEVKDFIAQNPTVKAIMFRNIQARVEKDVAKEKEAWTTQLEAKHASEKEQAVNLAEKRVSVKLSMTEGRAKAIQVKLDHVSKAAQETPQRAVVEVWDEAKVLKVPPPTPLGLQASKFAAGSNNTQSPATASPQTTTPAQTQRPPQISAPSGPRGPINPPVPSNPANAPQPTPKPNAPQLVPQPNNGQAQPKQTPNQIQQQIPRGPHQPSQPQGQNASGLPRPNAATGPTAMRAVSSGIPVPGGNAPGGRGGLGQSTHAPSSRGGRGGGRGSGIRAPQSLSLGFQQQQQQQQQAGSLQGGAQQLATPTPTSASPTTLNAGAKQFVPGVAGSNKRPREDGGGEEGGGAGKKIRGASGAGPAVQTEGS